MYHKTITWALTLAASFLFVSLICAPNSSFAQSAASPLVIPFQGQVTNQQGGSVANAQYSIVFNLYDVAVGGQPLWTERHSKVGVVNGMVNVFLGSIISLAAVDFSQTRYLGITVDVDDKPTTPDPEMVPRQMIIPAFHAKNAEKLGGFSWSSILVAGTSANDPVNGRIRGDKIADTTVSTAALADDGVTTAKIGNLAITNAKLADAAVSAVKLADASVTTVKLADGSITSAKLSSDVSTPPGTVVAYVGDTAPSGWLLCNGTDVSRAIYPNLAAVVGIRFGTAAAPATNFKLPDFQGYFLRGVDNSAGRDPDKAARTAMNPGGAIANNVGSIQADQFGLHAHQTNNVNYNVPTWGQGTTYVDGGNYLSGGPGYAMLTEAKGGNETRPKNAYVNYIIKY